MNSLKQNLENSNHVTMSSLEIVDFINSFRQVDGETLLRHDNFMAKVPKVLGELAAPKFLGVDIFTNGTGGKVTRYIYSFPKREACLMAMSYSYELQAAVFDRMTALEEENKKPVIPQTYAEALQLAADQAHQLELAAPKIQHYDTVVERSALLNATQVAQKVGWSAVKLNKVLEDLKVYSKAVLRGRVFRQWFIEQNLGIMRQTEVGYSQPMFTTKGEVWIVEKLISEGLV